MTMALYMITIVIVKARGIIHIAFRVHALSNVIKMLATPHGVAYKVRNIWIPALTSTSAPTPHPIANKGKE